MNTIDLINSHKSIRQFKPTPIDESLLNRILTCGTRASNTGNMQLYSIIVTEKPERVEALSKLHFGQCASAPIFLTICADIQRYHHWCRLSECDEPYDNFLWFMSGTIDATLAAQNISIAAETEGLGICYLGTVLYNTQEIATFLDLPAGVVPVITIAMGYPNEESRMSERLPLAGVVHRETYHHYSDSDIEEIHAIRENFPFNQEMVKINGTKNLAEIFTQIRYPKADNIRISKELLTFIEKVGFMNQK